MTYTIAKTLLSEQEKQRLMCCFFHKEGKIDFAAAARDFGAASSHSMSVMVGSTLKKIRDAKATQNLDSEPPAPQLLMNAGTAKGRKRKAEETEESGGRKRSSRVTKSKSNAEEKPEDAMKGTNDIKGGEDEEANSPGD